MENWRVLKVLRQFRQYGLLLIIGVFLFFIFRFGFLNPVFSVAQTITVPVQSAFYQSFRSLNNVFGAITQVGGLRSSNSSLRVENALLKSENARLKKLEDENKSLRDQLGTKLEDLQLKAAVRPIGRGPSGIDSILLVDGGQNKKILKNDLVIYKNILLGIVSEVTPRVSSVQLLTDPSIKIPVITEGGAEGILEGEFGSEMNLTNVVQDETLVKGQLVLTSGKNNFPKGLVVGEIDKVNKIEKEFFQRALLRPLLNIKDLNLIYIISGS